MSLMIERTQFEARRFLESVGDIFAIFDARTQDSGNVSFGVQVDAKRYFVKTPGDPSVTGALLDHAGRIAVLENAVAFAQSVRHAALPRLLNVIASASGPMLVYEWLRGDLVHVPAELRVDPSSAFQRFRALPLFDLLTALEAIIEVHVQSSGKGWVACDFYDGSIIYDFERKEVHLVDLDHYHRGPFTNVMGRMLGSTRFMAPEEFVRGALVDETTTTYVLGRMLSVFVGDGTLERSAFRGSEPLYALMQQACATDRALRFQTVAELAQRWWAVR